MSRQTTSTILMIEPVLFGFNKETAVDNLFQKNDEIEAIEIQNRAKKEFLGMVDKLKFHGIDVIVVRDTQTSKTPDSIFPNNWVTFHSNSKVVLYPMFAKNRRKERRMDVLEKIRAKGFIIKEIVEYSDYENKGVFLEGTGSMILDRENNIAYGCISERTDKKLFLKFCSYFGFYPVFFHATHLVEGKNYPIYHTNVMMSMGENVCVICLESVKDLAERKELIDAIENKSNKQIISISENQMNCFAGNILELSSKEDKNYYVMSNSAYNSFNKNQLDLIFKNSQIIVVEIPTIERYGGGSARCMMAEIFLPKKEV